MKLKKTAIAILTGFTLFALPLVASAAQPIFPNITGFEVDGSKVTFLTMDGITKSLKVQLATIDDSTGKLVKSTLLLTNGFEPPDGNILIPDNSGHFIDFFDTIVFDEFTLFLFTINQIIAEKPGDISTSSNGQLLAPTGNQAFGPVEFQLIEDVVSNGFRKVILGAAEVKISITSQGKGVLIVNKFQPLVAFKNNSTASGITTKFYDAKMSMSSTPKAFQLFTSAL